MLTLYHAPRSRSTRFLWLLEELGVPYDVRYVNIRRGDGSGARDPADPHPHGKVPVIEHDGQTVFESAAICAYLSDTFPHSGLGPLPGDPKRGAYMTWLAYYAGVMEPAYYSKFRQYDVPHGTPGWVDADEAMDYVTGVLAKNDYLLGDRFSTADLLFGSSFALFMGGPFMPRTPLLEAYVARVTARPAYARGMAKDSPPAKTA